MNLALPVALPPRHILPPPELFAFRSELHGRKHVARVMVHAFRLLHATGAASEGPRLWAAVYLCDLARTLTATANEMAPTPASR